MPIKLQCKHAIITLLLASLAFSTHADDAINIPYDIVKSRALPSHCFTQGFVIQDDFFYLSCGLYQQSTLIKLHRSNNSINENPLPKNQFAEGLTLYQKRLYILEWKSSQISIHRSDNLNLISTHKLEDITEAWGLALSQQPSPTFLLSDGSDQIQRRNTNNFNMVDHFKLRDRHGKTITAINELEVVGELLFANIWQKNQIIIADLKTHNTNHEIEVLYKIDFQKDIPMQYSFSKRKVLNGIAYDKQTDCIWLTGKQWGVTFALALTLPKKLEKLAGTAIKCQT